MILLVVTSIYCWMAAVGPWSCLEEYLSLLLKDFIQE
jgi:hypothetical protein